MNEIKNRFVYALIYNYEIIYYGSCSNLHKRMIKHISDLKINKHHCKDLQDFFINKNIDELNYKIIIQKECTILDIRKIENEYIKNNRNTILNSINAIFDYEEHKKLYYEQNKNEINEKHKLYYEQNKTKIKQHR